MAVAVRTFLVTLSVPVRWHGRVPRGAGRMLPRLYRRALHEMAENTDNDLTQALAYVDKVQEDDVYGAQPVELSDWERQ